MNVVLRCIDFLRQCNDRLRDGEQLGSSASLLDALRQLEQQADAPDTATAKNAADADVAATLIANAVDLPGCSAIERTPASEISPDSDLGAIPVTTAVGALTNGQIQQALDRGKAVANDLLGRKLIGAACLQLCDIVEQVGSLAPEQRLPDTPDPRLLPRKLSHA